MYQRQYNDIILACSNCETHIAEGFHANYITLDENLFCYKIKTRHTQNLRHTATNIMHCKECNQPLGMYGGVFCYINLENLLELIM